MRQPIPSQPQLRADPIAQVQLNLHCRDEIIPILRALQHLYCQPPLRKRLFELVQSDINATTNPKLGRPGLTYWEITVLASVRLGCNLNYDKLQDLAENHRRLRQIMGIRDTEEQTNPKSFDWRRLQDNISQLRPETLQQINNLIVDAGHQLVPDAAQSVRGDTFVVQTNIHHPTDSRLIQDGCRKLIENAVPLAKAFAMAGWRQHRHLLQKVKSLVRQIHKAARSKAKGAKHRRRKIYQKLFPLAEKILSRTDKLLQQLPPVKDSVWQDGQRLRQRQALEHFLPLVQQVVSNARRRILDGKKVPNDEKIFSLFEPHTELIHRGKTPNPLEFGHKVLVLEDAAGFVCHYQVMERGVQDAEVAVPVLKQAQQQLQGKIEYASFDRGFHSPDNQRELSRIVAHPCVPTTGQAGEQEQQVEFRQSRQHHPGVESAIGALQSGNGQERCRDRGEEGYQRYVGLGMLGRNLHVLGKLLLAREDPKCEAGQSQRKRRGQRAA